MDEAARVWLIVATLGAVLAIALMIVIERWGK